MQNIPQSKTMTSKVNLVLYTIVCVIVLSKIISCSSVISNSKDHERKVYIVYMGALREGVKYSTNDQHLNLLSSVVGETISASDYLVKSYNKSFNGFAAKLTEAEAQKLASREDTVSVFPSRKFHIQTTRSWDFVGLPVKAERQKQVESDIIIGVIDSGLWPELDSFSDEGFGPPPKKWKGTCKGGKNFTCNNKVIGARYYGELTSVRDDNGHGSHTASIAAGNAIDGASFYGLAKGTLRGGVPSSRIAAYRVCDSDGECDTEDILAAFDDAIADGVDIITISVGFLFPVSFVNDVIAIGAFHAMEKGILTTQAAGNYGPAAGTIISNAPWLFSVAATTIDRKFIDKIVLGNGNNFTGRSINSFPSTTKSVPLLHGDKLATNASACAGDHANSCASGCLDKNKVKGNIVLCDTALGADDESARTGALGALLRSDEKSGSLPSLTPILPVSGSVFTHKDYDSIRSYYSNTTNPRARILKSEAIVDKSAPEIAYFSSRGPNTITPNILKPDISAPGVNILAGFTLLSSPSMKSSDKRRSNVTIMSGTSMACPHAAGAVAYVKSFHPTWSPSAIKSAIMTTAREMLDNKDKQGFAPEFSYGSGLIDPIKAVNPGLVYEIEKEDYLKFLCSMGYDSRLISGDKVRCPEGSNGTFPASKLNYPNLMFEVPEPKKPFEISLNRTVTNVGSANSTYKANIVYLQKAPVKVEVNPSVLSFKSVNEKKSFTVKVSGKSGTEKNGDQYSIKLSWSDGKVTVNSTVIVYTDVKL